MPEHAGFHHVALLGGADPPPAPTRELEGDPGDALDLVGVVDLRVDRPLLSVAKVDDLLRLAEVNAAGQFAHDHDIEPVDNLALQRRGVGKRRVADRRPQVGVELQLLAQTEQAGLGPMLVGHVIPARAADGAEQHGISRLRLGHVRLTDRRSVSIVGAAADQPAVDLEARRPLRRVESVQRDDHLLDLGHDFAADPVAGQEE